MKATEGGNKMKKFLLGVIAFAVPALATAGVNIGISIGIPLPPPIVFGPPPVVVVLLTISCILFHLRLFL